MPVPSNIRAPRLDVPLEAYLRVLLHADEVEDGPMHVLRMVRAAQASLRLYEHRVAHAALDAGASFSELGRELGMTKQGAARRYAEPPKVDREWDTP